MGNRKRTAVRQRDASDCGPACILSVLSHYKVYVPVSQIRQIAGTDTAGTSMWGMIKALEHHSFTAKGLSGSREHLDRLPVPFIAHLNLGESGDHYVCIYHVRPAYLVVMDPVNGRHERWSSERFGKCWSGALIALVPGIRSPSGGEKRVRPIKRILNLLHPVRSAFIQAMAATVLYTLLGLSTSLYLGQLTDRVLYSGNTGLLNQMGVIMAVIVLVSVYLYSLKNLLVVKTGQVIDNQLICSYFRHLFRLPQRFFDRMMTGEILSRVNDAIKIRGFINDALIGILVNAFTLLFSLATMILLNLKLALLVVGILPVYLAVYGLYNGRNRRTEREVMERGAEFEGQVVESLQSQQFIRQFDLSEVHGTRIEGKLNRLLDIFFRSGLNMIRSAGSMEFLNRALTLALLWIGAGLVLDQQISAGTLMSFFALSGYFTGPAASLIGANKSYQNAVIATDRLFEILELEPEEMEDKPCFLRWDFGDIEFHRVTFSYGTRGFLFRNLNLRIPAGSVTLISGSNGSGKSTVAALIQQLYPPESGKITINGRDTRYYAAESFRRMMGVVPQHIRITTGSLLENLVPGIRDPDLGRVEELISQLGLHHLVDGLKEGLYTQLLENGSNLSGGERQRIAIARALYRDPPMLILDEATASLDPGSARHVWNILKEQKKRSKTILLISHLDRSGGLADRHMVMESGKLIDDHP